MSVLLVKKHIFPLNLLNPLLNPRTLRSLFWIPKINSAGDTYYFSPLFKRISLNVPEQAAGGFLAEEMVSCHHIEIYN